MGLARFVAENARPAERRPDAPLPIDPAPIGELHGDITLRMRRPSLTPPKGRKVIATFPAIGVENRVHFTVATCVLLLLFTASLVIAPGFVPETRIWGISLQALIGIFATILLLSNFLVAARRRGLLGLGGRGHYAIWVGVHLCSTLGALAVLSVHVSGRHGHGAALVAAVSVGLVAGSGIPGAILWQRTTGENAVVKAIKRHWLRVHIVLLSAFLVGLVAHIIQVTYF